MALFYSRPPYFQFLSGFQVGAPVEEHLRSLGAFNSFPDSRYATKSSWSRRLFPLSIPFRIPARRTGDRYREASRSFQFLSGFQTPTGITIRRGYGDYFQFLSGFQWIKRIRDGSWRLRPNFQFLSGFQPHVASIMNLQNKVTFNSFPDSSPSATPPATLATSATFNSFPDSS